MTSSYYEKIGNDVCCIDKEIPFDKTYKELTAENAELEKKLSSASKESVRKKLEISQKLNELDELRRTVDAIPDEVIREYTARKYVHHGRMNQEI